MFIIFLCLNKYIRLIPIPPSYNLYGGGIVLKIITPRKVLILIVLHIIPILLLPGYHKIKDSILSNSSSISTEYQRWEDKLAEENPDYDNLIIYVDINAKTLYLLKDNKEVVKKYPVATGRPDRPTPIGAFKIVNKAKWDGPIGSRWMGLNVPWGSYGIHGTDTPQSIGHNASSGCVRLKNEDIEDLYSIVKVDTVVIIDGGLFGPFGNGFRTLTPGDRGSDVAEVQNRLTSLGYYKGPINGIYEEGVRWALKAFLKDKGMKETDKITYEIYTALGIRLVD